MIDKFYHFFVSLGLAVFFAFLLMAKAPTLRHAAPRFWHSEQAIVKIFTTLVVAFSLILALTFGIWKEWIDELGFGNVEFTDFLADLAGVWLGVYLVIGRMKKEFKRRRKIRFHSQSNIRSKPVNLFRPPRTNAGEAEPDGQENPLAHLGKQLRSSSHEAEDGNK